MLASKYFHKCVSFFLFIAIITSGCIEVDKTGEVQKEKSDEIDLIPPGKEAISLMDLEVKLSPEMPTIHDNVTIFIDLVYPTAGYRIDFGHVTKKEDNFVVNITALPPSGVSAQVITGYSHKYDIGRLVEGRYGYEVFLNGKAVVRRKFDVAG